MAKAKSGKKSKLTIDLGKHGLSDEDRFNLLGAVQKAVSSGLKANEPEARKKAPGKSAALKGMAESAGAATITATFRETEPGLSELVATHNGLSKTITESDTLRFENVQGGDTIRVEVRTLGQSAITIDRKAQPQGKTTSANSFRFLFVILE